MSERERALAAEVAALRAELAHLRAQGSASAAPTGSPLAAPADETRVLLGALASVFPIGVFRSTPDGSLVEVDERLQQMFGLNEAGFRQDGWLARVHPDDRERVKAAWVRGIAEGNGLSVEFRVRSPQSGDDLCVVARNLVQRDAQGQLIGHLGFVQDISQLRRLEAQARLKDELSRQIITSSLDCTKVLDLEGRVLQMTEQGCRLIEVDDFEQVRGSRWVDWWDGAMKEKVQGALDQARREGSGRFVAMCRTFKGNLRWWDTLVSPINGPDGGPAMLLAVSRDITASYEQQEQIRRLNAELESGVQARTAELALVNERLTQTLRDAQELYDHAPCGYHSLDHEGVYALVNQTELDWLGYAREALVGQVALRELVAPACVAALDGHLSRLFGGEPADPVELVILRKDGSSFEALLSSRVQTDADGRVLRANSTLIDITERKAAERAMQEQDAFLQTIVNAIPVQFAFFDNDLVCRFANHAFARQVGVDAAVLVGMSIRQIEDAEDLAFAMPMLTLALQGEAQHFEARRGPEDGTGFFASIQFTPYVNDGQVQGLFVQWVDITERKASEDRVRKANRQLEQALRHAQTLYNQAPCGYHSLDINGVYVEINDTELRWLGYERNEVVGQLRFSDLLLPSRVPLLEERRQKLLEDGTNPAAEYELHRKDGSVLHVLVSSSAVRDEQGGFLRSNTTVVDITQRKHAELALRENQRFLQTVTNHVPGLIAYLDAMLRLRFANNEHRHMYGINPQDILGLHASECLPVSVWHDIRPHLQGALDGKPQHFESWHTPVQGAPVYVSATFLPDMHDGLVQGVIMQVIDITERKRVEERVNQLNDELEIRIRERSTELLESEQRFRLMADNLREYSIFFLDAQGHITDWTDSAQRMEGYSPSEMLGQHYTKLLLKDHPQDAQSQAEVALRMAASRGQHEQHGWLTRKDGSMYWAHSLIIALRDDGGELRGFSKISRDMTDAKRLDDLMRNINDELESRVTERTEQLLAANKDLESFSYSVSHDLRAPLRHISSFVSLLEEHLHTGADETTRRYLTTISNSSRHMSQLIDGLLAFSRLGRSAVNVMQVDFGMLVDAVVNQMSHDTEGRLVDWVIAADLPVVQGDALLLREVWANLLGNAFKYTRPRERARIEVGWSVDPAVGYTFFVKDNGVGFDLKLAQKLFGVFQRFHRASEFEGTGIGLALTRRILERHGGSIWAESKPGEGSVFHFSLPFEGVGPSGSPHDTIPSVLEP